MSKATVIRKRALDLVRDQDWSNAIKEYKRLVELDQNNPNVHNELADLYLKTNQKADAYDSFARAVDEYARVGLHNNAVAVCKKVLRVLPARVEVLTKLGYVRSRQGLTKEAESYYLQFLEKAGVSFEPAAFGKLASQIAEEMKESPAVLQRLAQALVTHALNDEARNLLIKLYQLNEKLHDAGGIEATRAMINRLGFGPELDAILGERAKENGRDGAVITEQNIWTASHSQGERIEIESTPRFAPSSTPAAPAPQPAGAASDGPSERDLYLLRLARGSAEPLPKAAPAAPAASAAPEPPAPEVSVTKDEVEAPEEAAVATETRAATETLSDVTDEMNPEPVREVADEGTRSGAPAGVGATIQVSALLGDDVGGDGEADFRSHYDLGMAYLEMDLLAEAIREYQLASRSPQFQVKCLEMIGLCFVKQNQPQLAVRQLNKGLTLIDSDSEDALGIKYNLALAYEMLGDSANARRFFEDVYVVDVAFRDVAEKMRKFSTGR